MSPSTQRKIDKLAANIYESTLGASLKCEQTDTDYSIRLKHRIALDKAEDWRAQAIQGQILIPDWLKDTL